MRNRHPQIGPIAPRREILKAAVAVGAIAAMPRAAFAASELAQRLLFIAAQTMEINR